MKWREQGTGEMGKEVRAILTYNKSLWRGSNNRMGKLEYYNGVDPLSIVVVHHFSSPKAGGPRLRIAWGKLPRKYGYRESKCTYSLNKDTCEIGSFPPISRQWYSVEKIYN
jgi:hypothetical protein